MWPRPRLAIAIAIVLFLSIRSAAGQDVSALTPAAQSQFRTAWAQQPRVDLGVPADGARIVVVKFNDYECPSCAQAERWYGPVLARFAQAHPGAVRLVYRDWPWNVTCNPNAGQTIPGHEAACAAAAAARLAGDRGKFEEMKDWLFAHQGVTPEAVGEEASRLLGITDFSRASAGVLPDIQRDIAQGGTLKVGSTPTYFINGVRLPDTLIIPELFELALDVEFSGAKAGN